MKGVGRGSRRIICAAVVVAVLALGASGLTWAFAPDRRQSSAVVAVVPPVTGRPDDNPLLRLSPNISRLASVLSAGLHSAAVADSLRRQGATASYRVSWSPGPDDGSALVVLTATDSSSSQATRTAAALTAQADTELGSIQARSGAPAAARATLLHVAGPSAAHVVGTTSAIRAAWVFGVILVLGWLGILLVVRFGPAAATAAFAPPALPPVRDLRRRRPLRRSRRDGRTELRSR